MVDPLTDARHRMVEYQLQSRGISDARVLEAMSMLPREKFVPPSLEMMAYDDSPLPIGEGQTISQPYMVALMTELLELEGTERVLEIGTGSGYQAAVMASVVPAVVTLERHASISTKARDVLESLGLHNIRFIVGDGSKGCAQFAPYQRIIVTAAAPEVPPELWDQLDEGGILIIPVGPRFEQVLRKVRKVDGVMEVEESVSCVFVPLVGERGFVET